MQCEPPLQHLPPCLQRRQLVLLQPGRRAGVSGRWIVVDASSGVGGVLHRGRGGGAGERVGDVPAVFYAHHRHRHDQLLCVQSGSSPSALLRGAGVLGCGDGAGLQLALRFSHVQGGVLPHRAQRLRQLLLPGSHEPDPVLLRGHGAQIQRISVQQIKHLLGGHGLHLGCSSGGGLAPSCFRPTGTFGRRQRHGVRAALPQWHHLARDKPAPEDGAGIPATVRHHHLLVPAPAALPLPSQPEGQLLPEESQRVQVCGRGGALLLRLLVPLQRPLPLEHPHPA